MQQQVNLFGEADYEKPSLADSFGVPPFTVLDERAGYWGARKRKWLSLGIESELGRGDGAIAISRTKNKGYAAKRFSSVAELKHTSVFDPVLCELAYRWFAPPGGRVLDPFAGGSVRGIVAAKLGYQYTGIDLRAEQLAANEMQASKLGLAPTWLQGDSATVLPTLPEHSWDLLFTCPPYYDLEKYSDDRRDLSNASDYLSFLDALRSIIQSACRLLRPGRFAVIVIGDLRDRKTGYLRGLPQDTIRAFADSGMQLYNDGILIQPMGSLGIRTKASWEQRRKLGRGHQHVLVFFNGTSDEGVKREFSSVPQVVIGADFAANWLTGE